MLRKGLPLLVALINFIAGQFSYFGKNKVQTRDYQFQSFETEHFNVLFYPGGEGVAEFAAKTAEGFYSQLSQDLKMELEDKVPLILYLSPAQFRETNIITDLIEEGVGGFSELLKNRIVIPFNGSYRDLYYVIGHELTHIFEFRMFYRSRLAVLLGAVGEFQIPLWVLEGFAEFISRRAQVGGDFFIRDLVINNRLVPLPELNDYYGYLAYREGESFFRYVAERYGREKVYEFLNTLKSKRNLEATFQAVFGMSQKRMGTEWEKWLKVRYWPQVVKISNFDSIAERLTDHTVDGSVFNTAPSISPSGTRIVMISDRAEYTDCYLISATDGRVLKKLVRGERSGGFENLHLIRPGVAWSPDEKTVAIVATTKGRDNIAIIDVNRGSVKRRIFGSLDAIYSPKFSPDGKRIVFVGVKNGFSDIYEVLVEGGEPRRLTYDMFEDKDPEFSLSGDTIVFVSDRPQPGEDWFFGEYAVWLRLPSGELQRLTERGGFYGYPVFSRSGEFIFWVTQDSFSYINGYSLREKRVVWRREFLGEVAHLSLSRDDKKLALAYFSQGGWDIGVIFNPMEKLSGDTVQVKELVEGKEKPSTPAFYKSGLDFDKVKPVGFNLSLDYLAGYASYTTGPQGFTGSVLLGFSDILGNHRFELYTELFGDILNSNFLFQYWLLPYRTDFGFTLFQWFDIPVYYPGYLLTERISRGIQAITSYPFDRFTRVEVGLTGIGSEIGVWRYNESTGWGIDTLFRERTFFLSGAFVFDNIFWESIDPVRGLRARLELGGSFLSTRQFEGVAGELRHYLRLGRRFVFASRLIGAMNFGETDSFYLGGEDVRGYNWGEFYEQRGPALGLINLELRYPFIDQLKLAFPLPIEIKNIRGVAFLDGGMVFKKGMRVWDQGSSRFEDLKLGAGFGLRFLILSYFYLKLDFAKPLSTTTDRSWKFIFELGYDY